MTLARDETLTFIDFAVQHLSDDESVATVLKGVPLLKQLESLLTLPLATVTDRLSSNVVPAHLMAPIVEKINDAARLHDAIANSAQVIDVEDVAHTRTK